METVTITRKKKKTSQESKRVTNVLKLLYMLLIQDNKDIEYYAERLGCKKPTIKKYLNDIKLSYDANEYTGFEVDYDRRNDKYRLFSDLKFTAFSPEEIEALHMAIKYLTKQQGSVFDNLKDIEQKLRKVFTKEIMEKLKKPVEISGPDTESRLKDLIDIIDEAINRKKKLLISYIPTYHKEKLEREIVPLSLLNHDSEWYIRAFCLKDRKIKTYSVNQIEKMEMKHLPELQRRIVPEQLPPQEHMWDWAEPGAQEEEVVIRFPGRMGERMKKKLRYRKEHKSQKVVERGDGVDVYFSVKNPGNMVSWVFQFVPWVEVIRPEELRGIVRERLRDMAEMYE